MKNTFFGLLVILPLFASATEVDFESLKCELYQNNIKTGYMEYAGPSGEMHFTNLEGGELFPDDPGYHWDGFNFQINDNEPNRLYVVYHDGGEPSLSGADAYIDLDRLEGEVLFDSFGDNQLKNCETEK